MVETVRVRGRSWVVIMNDESLHKVRSKSMYICV